MDLERQAGEQLAPPVLGAERPGEAAVAATASERRPWTRWFAFSNIGAIYVWALVIVLFAVWVPETFATVQTAKNVLNNQAITALMALSLIVPLSAAVFDLSIAYTMGVCAITVAKLIAHGMSPGLAVLLTMLLAVTIGIANGFVVVVMKIDSFIGTLATGALLQSLILIISDQPIASPELLGSFSKLARTEVVGITIPVLFVLVVAVALWYLLEHTPTGRHIYATGYGLETARLSGIRTDRLRFASLVISATLAGFAGIVVTARVTTGSPTIGPPYLLPAFAAAFVGATQLRQGRFNPWGTILAVLLLGTGTEGLADVGAPVWGPSVFIGVTLIIAVGLTGFQRRRSRGSP